MNIKKSIEKMLEIFAFKRRQRQFCEFIEAIEKGDVQKVKKMLHYNPKLVDLKCMAPKGLVAIPSWLKTANPLAIALVPTLVEPSANHVKIVDILLQYGADPMSNNDNLRMNNVLDVFLTHTLNNAPNLDDSLSIGRMMCNRIFVRIDHDYILQDVLEESPTWRHFQKDNPLVCKKMLEDVEVVKSENTKQIIQKELGVITHNSVHRKM